MTFPQLHDGLANAAMMFAAIIGVWALFLRLRSRTLDGAWYGAAVICELLILAQAAIGVLMYIQGLGAVLPRPFMHILYGIVAVVTLPAAYSYMVNLEDENVKTLLMALVCLFLWGILQRAASVAQYMPTPL